MVIINNDRLYLFYGYGCEYSLAPLANYMRERSFNVIELDLLYISNTYEILKSIKGKDVVFITSWHLFFDKNNFNKEREMDVLSPLEVIDYLKPVRSIYYPHDLTTFLHEEEWSWLDLFDVVLAPYKNNDYFLIKKHTQVVNVGWIKKQIPSDPVKNKEELRIVHFPSNLSYIKNFSPEQYYEMWKPLFNKGVCVKFPLTGSFERYKKALEYNGVKLIDPSKTVFDIINDYNIIISTGSSSVAYEAGLSGRPVIAVLDGAIRKEKYHEILPDHNWLYKLDIIGTADLIDEVKKCNIVLNSGPDVLPPMNFEKAVNIITA